MFHLHHSNQDPQVSFMLWLVREPGRLGSERAPVGRPVGTGELGPGVNWWPAGATAAEGTGVAGRSQEEKPPLVVQVLASHQKHSGATQPETTPKQ